MEPFGRAFGEFMAAWLAKNGMTSLGRINRTILSELAQEFYATYTSAEKVSKKRTREKRAAFVPPTPEEATGYARSIGFRLDGQRFCAHYESNGWKVGKNPMVDWKASVRTWKASAEPRDLLPEQPTLNGHKAPKEPVGWQAWGRAAYPSAVYWEGWSFSALPPHVRQLIEKEMPKP